MRHDDASGPGTAASGARSNALWGGKRPLATGLAVVAVLLALGAGSVQASNGSGGSKPDPYLSPRLLDEAKANPDELFDVIVQARSGAQPSDVAQAVLDTVKDLPSSGSRLGQRFFSIDGASATLTGKQIARLAKQGNIEAITRDSGVHLTGYSNGQLWPSAANVAANWAALPWNAGYPTIAVVDSGVTNWGELGNRFLGNVNFVTTSTSNGAYGHGTFVSTIAAGEDPGYAGAEPHARIVSLKVLDGNGVGKKSDVIAACDWILRNKSAYNIRVANFSLNTGGEPIQYDALDQAVEKLWLNGVTVVVAAGNYAVNGAQSNVGYAPANDPFVITVGASDVHGTPWRSDDFAAPWSAWGYTQDGFRKPEVAAPGRYLIGGVPTGANMLSQFPSRQVAPNYMWMSGTSFAAPIVSGIAATLLAKNPSWTPDQVKGAIMETASVPKGYDSAGALGVGVVSGNAALGASGAANPNAGLDRFRAYDSTSGLYTFDASAWRSNASANASWNSASWSSASWSSASWSSASWSSASWSSASWADASWSSASWASASWADGFDGE
jgi:serine protease AprX